MKGLSDILTKVLETNMLAELTYSNYSDLRADYRTLKNMVEYKKSWWDKFIITPDKKTLTIIIRRNNEEEYN